MIIFFKQNSILPGSVSPVALVDYTRSDDQFSTAEITKWVQQTAAAQQLTVAGEVSIFSLDYTAVFKHSAVNLADSLKTQVHISVSNAPAELVSLVQVEQLVGQETVMSLQNALSRVVDPKNNFSRGTMVFKIPGPFFGVSQNIVRNFIVYGTTYNFDSRRINSTLEIRGASFDSMVMRLALSFNIEKTLPLLGQIQTALAESGSDLQVTTDDPDLPALMPVVARYYPPAPLNRVLNNLCRDNGIFYDLLSTGESVLSPLPQIVFKSAAALAVPADPLPAVLSFRASVPNSYVIGEFSVRDYATAMFKTEAFDLKLFDTAAIYDDSYAPGLFGNFRKFPVTPLPDPRHLGGVLFAYGFYTMEYTYVFSSHESTVSVLGTNNWLVSNFKLDTFFENAVYGDATP